jgi:cephalosporin-C deacetylase-like acetyl esterase
VALSAALLAACGHHAAVTTSSSTTSTSPLPPESDLFSYDSSEPLDATEGPVTNGSAVEVQEVQYKSFDGDTVPAILARPRNLQAPYRCLVFQGGLDYTPTEGFFLQNPLIAGRYEVLSIEPRFSGSRITSKVEAFAAQHDPNVLAQLIRATVIDLRRGIDYLESRPDCKQGGVGYIGISFGGILGSLLAGADSRVQAPALIAAGGNWRILLKGTDLVLPGVEDQPARFDAALQALAPLDPDRWVPRISPRPVLMINGRHDHTVVPPAAMALHAAAGQPKKVVWYAGGHDPFTGPWAKRVTATLTAWLVSNLGR